METETNLNPKEAQMADDIRRRALATAYVVTKTSHIRQHFKLNPDQERIFTHYFAGYFTLKTGLDLSRIARNPIHEALSRVAGLSRSAEAAIRRSEVNDSVGNHLLAEAEDLCKCFRDNIYTQIQGKIFRAHQRNPRPKLETLLADNSKLAQLHERVLRNIGSPAALRNAANLISAVYVEHQWNQKEAQLEIENALSNITIK